jgi:riboflavin biosynthesis pyrimidine reductase
MNAHAPDNGTVDDARNVVANLLHLADALEVGIGTVREDMYLAPALDALTTTVLMYAYALDALADKRTVRDMEAALQDGGSDNA